LSVPQPSIRLPHPDRVSIWPTERGYGVDVTWSGADGFRDADRLTAELKRLGMQARLIQELGRSWTSRVGPVDGAEARQVVALFVR
jgi:hypothetical protein